MGSMTISSAVASDLTNSVDDFSVSTRSTDGINHQQKLTWYQNEKWTQQWGYFNAIPDLKSALLMKAVWNVGKGYTCKLEADNTILDGITGWGKDTFDDILFNMEVIKRVSGDAIAEIVRDPVTNNIINLKPLDPGSIGWWVNSKGVIEKYEQINKTGNGKPNKIFQPEDILHFSHNRLADQIHGISDIDVLEKTILAEEESFDDIKKAMHRQARPMILFKLDTDKQSEIDAFKAKMDSATNLGENMYVPFDENTVSFEQVNISISELILAWRNDIRNKFYRTIGLPQVVPGAGGQSTESESKVIYLAFEQIVEKEQRQIEKQIYQQTSIDIDLYPPTTISEQLQTDSAKDGAANLTFQPSDTQAGVGR